MIKPSPIFLLLFSSAALAESGFHESEPNDRPTDFHAITGEVTLYGTMVGQDQDGFIWTVTDNDARKRWSFELHGEPGALTILDIVRLEYADNDEDVTGKETLVKMGTRDGAMPSVLEGLMFEPGEYVLGLAQSGAGKPGNAATAFRPPVSGLTFMGTLGAAGGDEAPGDATGAEPEPGAYRLLITEAGPIHPARNPGPRPERDLAHTLRLKGRFATFEPGEIAWYRLEFSEADAAQRWDLHVQAPVGRHLEARLHDGQGGKLAEARANAKGKLRFPDLAPPTGTWYLELRTTEPGFIHEVSTQAVGERVAGEEAEPNSSYATANRVDLGQPLTGRIGSDDANDFFLFRAEADTADEFRTLRLETEPPVNVTLCLEDPKWANVQCRSGTAPVELPDLALAEGDWGISLGRAAEANWTLSWVSQGPVEAGREREPNDRPDHATGVPDNLRIKGRFSGSDKDFYQFMVTGEAQLWRFQVIGDEVFELGYYDGGWKQKSKVRAAGGQRRLRLDNLFLLPGRHFVRVEGRDGGSYTLLARALGPPDPNGEIEPNDEHNKQRLVAGQVRTGLSSDKTDQDNYRFFVGNWDHLRVTVTPPADGIVAPNLYWYDRIIGQGMPDEAGAPMVMQGLFPPGDYRLVLEPRQVSEAEYSVSLERLPRWSCPADCEPNGQGQIWLAAPLPPDLVLQGNSGDWRDQDYYQLPAFDAPTEMVIRSAEPTPVSLGTNTRSREKLDFDTERGEFRATVPAGEPHRLIIDSRKQPYRLELAFPGGPLAAVTEPLPLDLSLDLEAEAVSAYRINGQRVGGSLSLTNNGAAVLEADLEATTSDYRWRVRLGESRIHLPAGETLSVPLEVVAAADAWADQPVRISARALAPDRRQAETWRDIAVVREALPVRPVLHWPVPEPLRGGFNVAWLPFGAQWSGPPPTSNPVRSEEMRDDQVFANSRVEGPSSGTGWPRGEGPHYTLHLPGDAALPVAGMALNHFGTPGPFHDIRRATLLLSADGVQFDEVLDIEALPVETEQYFALEQPISARFARLRVDATFGEASSQRVFFAEWKVILDPAHDLSGGEGFNIADPALGGHVVWDWPPRPYSPRGILTPGDDASAANMRREPVRTYVVGFKQNRAAQISRIEWSYAENSGLDKRNFEKVEAAVSLGSPIGPWQPLGALHLDPETANGALDLAEATWARYVRFMAYLPEGVTTSHAPGQIRIFERAQGPDYQSALGEWGEMGSRGYYEARAGLAPEPVLVDSNHTARARAAPLGMESPVQGQVALGRQEHWYRLRVPQGDNTLAFTLEGDPTVRTVLSLEDASGEPVALRRIDKLNIPSRHRFEALAEQDTELWARVEEPPRNVVFTWDTSASVNAYIPLINNALVAFSSQVVPGREAVNLLPFNMGPLMKQWYGEPYMLQTTLNDYRRGSSSSSAERTLKHAAELLAPRAGTKAIVVVTDGETVHDGSMWGPVQAAQPRVFSVQVAGQERWHLDVMRDWSGINGGHFSQLRYDGEMEVAFDRAATLMHRPAGYTLQVASEYREAPGPGSLSIVTGAAAGGGADATGGAAVELILDASGSMLQRMEGKRRIAIAREVLTQAVTEVIPAGTPLALRVFGHREPDACRTDLEIPLGPLDPAEASKKINEINAMNLARTPIADSLAAAEGDLQDAAQAAIILVTDGEETCDGDAGKVIEAMRERGLRVSLNIVGFAIDDVELAAQFEAWAQAGGGRYFGADDQAGLAGAVQQALQIPFTVFDAAGEEVAGGFVGAEAVALEQGVYRVEVGTVQPRSFEAVEIIGEKQTTLTLE